MTGTSLILTIGVGITDPDAVIYKGAGKLLPPDAGIVTRTAKQIRQIKKTERYGALLSELRARESQRGRNSHVEDSDAVPTPVPSDTAGMLRVGHLIKRNSLTWSCDASTPRFFPIEAIKHQADLNSCTGVLSNQPARASAFAILPSSVWKTDREAASQSYT